jgi:hypothetical protein
MSNLQPNPADSEASPNPDVPPPGDESRRVWLTRRILRSAVLRFQLTLAFAREVESYFPEAYREPFDERESLAHSRRAHDMEHHFPDGDRGGWLRVMYEADSAFYAAEVELASRIVNLYDQLAPEGKRTTPIPAGREFQERAVTVDGLTFTVLYDPGEYEEGQVIIAMTPVPRTITLDD